jgi:hypothetical protein
MSNRSLLKAWQQDRLQKGYKQAMTVPGSWVKWANTHQWKKRAEAYDAHIELEVRRQDEAAHIAELAAFRQRARDTAIQTGAIATAALLITGKRLQDLDLNEIKPGMLPSYLRTAAAVMEASLNAEAEAIGVHRLAYLLLEADDDEDRLAA